jgi:dephospho-CoA kinase
MLKLSKIAVTGNVASGKSSICRYFKQLGAFVVDADKIVHDLLSSKTSVGQTIIKFLGNDILDKGEISREKVADKVFSDIKKLKKLEAIIHPMVFEEIENLYNLANKEEKYLFFVVEIPLLFETQQEKFYDYVIVVTKEKKKTKKFDVRENRLIDIDDKIKKADFVITNNSSFTMLKRQVTKIANILIKLIKENTLA